MGKILKGRLHIQTESTQYSYDLRGRQPTYNPPKKQTIAPKVDTRMVHRSKIAIQKQKGTNFVVANLKAAHKASMQNSFEKARRVG